MANYYLSPLDRLLQAHPQVRAVSRYMDDGVWWCTRKADALRTLDEARAFVADHLDLEIKRGGYIQRSAAGLSFLGFRVYPGVLKLSRRRQRRYRAARTKWEAAFVRGEISSTGLQQGYASALAITAHAAAAGFRRRDLELRPSLDV